MRNVSALVSRCMDELPCCIANAKSRDIKEATVMSVCLLRTVSKYCILDYVVWLLEEPMVVAQPMKAKARNKFLQHEQYSSSLPPARDAEGVKNVNPFDNVWLSNIRGDTYKQRSAYRGKLQK
ncbi:hypothetical protein IV203_003536 [Nitzschia inconspicua]|uniref:Uncharacterized protein n=1 Tax=Nitzschia inconspicua TaxID=303405 RepID=A0A9K3L3K9_9STRA|nr:hypothetical protein IV203_003536 [Nitzschia inconspicua]